MLNLKRATSMVAAGIMAVVMLPALASAVENTVTVYDSDVARQAENTPPTKNWVIYTRGAGTATFKNGPETPPMGANSLELSTPTGADKITIFNYDYVNKKLSDVNALAYSTYRSAGSASQVAALNLQVDVNGAAEGGTTTLVFEPVYNTDQGTVTSGEWQTWDAFKDGDAVWWSSNPIPGAPNRDTFVSWNTLIAQNPDAVISGGVGINQGSGNPGLTTSVDKLVVGLTDTTTYNFDVKPAKATSKDQCKNDGYKNFQTTYKNQGDCVSAVASGDKAKGNPEGGDFMTSVRKFFGL